MNALIQATTGALLLLTAASFPLAASTVHQQPPRMTGQQLIDNYQAAGDFSGSLQRPDLLMKVQAAEGYLAGVADAFHGTAWCGDGSVKQDEINSAVIFNLKKQAKESLSSPAAGLVKESLSKLYPCKKARPQ